MILSERFKLAFKIALAMVITYGIALSQARGTPFWAGFAVAFCGLTEVGDSLNKGLLGVYGTLFGAAAGLALLGMFPQERWSFMIAMSLFVAFCTYMMGGTTRWWPLPAKPTTSTGKGCVNILSKVTGFCVQVSGVEVVTPKNYMDVKDRGQNLEVGGQKRDILLWERLYSRDSTTGLAH